MRDPRNWVRPAGRRRGRSARPRAPASSSCASAPAAPPPGHAGRTARSTSPSARCTPWPRGAPGPRRDAVVLARRPLIRRGARSVSTRRGPSRPRTADLRLLADEDLMQLVRRGDAARVRGRLRAPLRRRVLARLPDGGHAAARAEDVVQEAFLAHLALRRPLRPHPRLGADVGARHRPPPRDRRAAARASSTTRRRASDEGLEERFEAARAHRRGGRPPRGGARGPQRAGRAARRAVAA